MRNNGKILNFSEYGVDDFLLGNQIIGQLYIRVDKDNSWHKYNAKFYGGQHITYNGVSKLDNGLYWGSGVKLNKNGLKERAKNGKIKMLEVARFDFMCSKKMLDSMEGWLITSLHRNFRNRCLNKAKIHSDSMDITKEIESKVETLLKEYLEKNGQDCSEKELARLMRNRKQRVYNWAKRHDYIDVRTALNNNMFENTDWDPLDLMLYQSLLNKKIMEKALSDIEDFVGYDIFEKENVVAA